MIYKGIRVFFELASKVTPNHAIPALGTLLTKGRLAYDFWAEVYLIFRFFLALALATYLSRSSVYTGIIIFVQACSLIYLLKIVFPIYSRNLIDPGRSLFFALGHYTEIGLTMSYLYWSWGLFSPHILSRLDATYFSFITMSTLGYGDYTPDSDLTKIMVVIHLIYGMFMFAVVVGLFLSMAADENPN